MNQRKTGLYRNTQSHILGTISLGDDGTSQVNASVVDVDHNGRGMTHVLRGTAKLVFYHIIKSLKLFWKSGIQMEDQRYQISTGLLA